MAKPFFVSIVCDKGGVGKTITSISLGTAAELEGRPTVIFDFDPRANSTIWGDRRESKFPEVIPAQVPRLRRFVDEAVQNEASLVIFDTPSNAVDLAREVCTFADLILMPCRPSSPDLLSIVPTIEMALHSGKPAYVLFNDAPHSGREVADARESFEAAGVSVCPVVLHSRKAFALGFNEGLTALDVEPRGKAAQEIRDLMSWMSLLELKTRETAGDVPNKIGLRVARPNLAGATPRNQTH